MHVVEISDTIVPISNPTC